MNALQSWVVLDGLPLRARLQQLGLPLHLLDGHWVNDEADAADAVAALEFADNAIQLRPFDKTVGSPVLVDFLHGKTGFRAQRFSHEMIVKAVAGRSKEPLTVVDATAGLGRDGFLLAAAGHQVTLIERHPVIATLLADGLFRAAQDGEMSTVCQRIQLVTGRAHDILAQMIMSSRPEVIYLDPMFPERQKSALVKKEMRIFREVVGDDEDAQDLLEVALQIATKRVVVKRPRKSETIGPRKPGHQLIGTSSRFDVYPV